MLQLNIESFTALSDMKKSHFCWSVELDFQCLAGPRNVSIYTLNMMFCACECLCMVYPLESGNGVNFVLVGGTACCNPT